MPSSIASLAPSPQLPALPAGEDSDRVFRRYIVEAFEGRCEQVVEDFLPDREGQAAALVAEKK